MAKIKSRISKVKIENNMNNKLKIISEKVKFLKEQFLEIVNDETSETLKVNNETSETSTANDETSIDMTDGLVQDVLSTEKIKNSVAVYEALSAKIRDYNSNIEKISINILKVQILTWMNKENNFNENLTKIESDLEKKFGIKDIKFLKKLITKRPNFFERNLPFWLLSTRNSRDRSRAWTKLKNQNKKIDPGKYLSDKYKKKINKWNKVIEKEMSERGLFHKEKLTFALRIIEHFKKNNFNDNVEKIISELYGDPKLKDNLKSKEEFEKENTKYENTKYENTNNQLKEVILCLEEQLEKEVYQIKNKNRENIFKLQDLQKSVKNEEINYDTVTKSISSNTTDEQEQLFVNLYKEINELKNSIDIFRNYKD